MKQKGRGSVNLLSLLELRYLSSPAFGHPCFWFLVLWTEIELGFLGSLAFDLGLEVMPSTPLVSGLPTQPGTTPVAFLALQFTDSKVIALLGFHNYVNQSCNKSLTYLSLYPTDSISLESPEVE